MEGSNDVLGSLTGAVDNVVGKVLDYKLASQRIRSGAAPSGTVVYTNSQNPAPGTQGAYPQAEAKPHPGGGASSVFSFSGQQWLLLAVAVVLVLVLFRGRVR